jgi:esterase
LDLYYRKYGSGPEIIILHGLFGMSDNWVSFSRDLSQNYEVFIPDQRNHGRSPHSINFDYSVLSNDIYQFCGDQKIKDIILIGHSMGGKVAMLFALEHPELIKKLIVLDISPISKTPSVEIMQIIDSISTLNLKELSTREEIKIQLSQKIGKRKIVEFLLKNIKRDENNSFIWKFNSKAIRKNLASIAGGIVTDKVFEKPTLFIGGEKSDYINGEEFYEIFKYFPTAEVEVIKGAGHWLHADAPDELLRIVKIFIES